MINLRQYQIDAIETIHQIFKKEFRQYIEMPTGSGKTVTFLSYAKKYHEKILIIVPSKELMHQVYRTSLVFFDDNQISRKGDGFNEEIKNVHICIVNSLRELYLENLVQKKFDLIIIDECHHAQSNSYKRFIKKRSEIFLNQKILGVTATPDRLDGKVIKEILFTCSFKIEIEKLIEDKFLCDVEGYSVKSKIDLSDIDHHNGDFNINELYKKLCTNDRNQMIVDLYKQHLVDRKTLVFCINIKHSKEICMLLNEQGIPSLHIDGTMNSDKRNSILSSFRKGEIKVLTNCQLLTEGFDEPSIDGLILSRPTKSRSLFLQMIGRGLRINKGKENCKIVDIVDNHKLICGFNSLITDSFFEKIENFKSMKELRNHVDKEILKVTEVSIERVNFFNKNNIEDEACEGMINYLEENNIKFYEPISFDEASFMIWMNELKKEYKNG